MTTLVIFGIIIFVGFLFRNKIAMLLLKVFKRQRKGPIIDHLGTTEAVFSPAGTVRTFVIALDIEEQGNGVVKISLAKKLDKKEL